MNNIVNNIVNVNVNKHVNVNVNVNVPVFAVEDGELAQDPSTPRVVGAGADEAEGEDGAL